MNFITLKRNLKKDFTGLPKIKIAVLGDSATQLLCQAIRAYGYEVGIDFDIWESDYDQITQIILDEKSKLYSFKPEFVLIFNSIKKITKQFYKTPINQKKCFAESLIDNLENLLEILNSRINTNIIYPNFVEQPDGIFGNFANKVESSFTAQIRELNYKLMKLAQKQANFHIFDINILQQGQLAEDIFDPKLYINTDNIFALDFLPIFAKNFSEMILPFKGKFKKCLILDLDNTIWGGIIGDDGIDKIQIGDLGIGKAFTELQYWAKQLKERGVILCICSKNTEHVAKEVFEKHPDMILRLDDIAVLMANWDSKVDNIKRIQSILNIGFDSMVFLDDNPFERNVVRMHLSDICVPELPEDPADYLPFLKKQNLFETISYTEADNNRTKQYQEEAKRTTLQQSFTSEEEFLKSLSMKSEVAAINSFSLPRVAQLSQRSNQFNLRTIRYTAEEIKHLIENNEWLGFTFNLNDKFGDYGLIAVILMHEINNTDLFIDTWIMSCRVLKRGMEEFTLNTIVEKAKEKGYKKLIGEYIPTYKNGIVKDHYKNLGFLENAGKWELDLSKFQAKKPIFIIK